MKKQLINTLMLAGVISFSVSACNSGASSNNNNNQSTQSTSSMVSTQEASLGEGLGGAVLDVVTGNLEDAIVGEVGSVFWNLITKGTVSPQTPAQWDKQALTQVLQGVSQIESEITAENAELNVISQNINTNAYIAAQQPIYQDIQEINNANSDINDFLVKAINNPESAQITENALLGTSSTPISNQALQSMLTYINNYNSPSLSLFTVPTTSANSLDVIEQQLSCDVSSPAYYTLNSASNATNHPVPSLTNDVGQCLLASALNSSLTDFTNAQSLTSGSNIFYNLQQYDQLLDSKYVQIVNTLAQAYRDDQLREILYLNMSPSAQTTISPVLTVEGGANLAAAESEIQIAYNTRLSFVQSLFAQAKTAAFNNYASSISSSNLQNNCNFNYQTIESMTYLTADMSDNKNLYGWDGKTLRMSCNNTQAATSGTITTNSSIAQMCNQTNGSYNLSSSNGYIRCGGGNNYGNYSTSNINSSPEPTDPLSSILQEYDGAKSKQLDYMLASNDGDGNLWLNFIGAPLVNYQYNGYNNGGLEANFQNPSNTFVNVYVNSYVGSGNVSSQWSYVDDGVHAYLISAAWKGSSPEAPRPIIMCIPNDTNCIQGFFPNSSGQGTYPKGNSGYGDYQALLFSNGDEITITQLMGHGDYNIQTFYNGAPAPIAMTGHSPAINFQNVIYTAS